MNMELFFQEKYVMLVLVCLATLAIGTKCLVALTFRRLIRAAMDMGRSRNKLMKQMRMKFETCYQLKLGVSDMDTFMDKYILEYRVCKVHLYTWENIGNQMFVLTLIASILGGVSSLYLNLGQARFFSIVLCGFALCGLILFLDGMMNLSMKKELLRIHMKDYLGNTCKPRLEQENFHPEELEKYRNEYFVKDEQETSEQEEKRKSMDGRFEIEFTKEEEKVIEEVLKEYMA